MGKVVVVGSGVIGLSCALYFALEGEKVQVITRNPQEATSWVAGGMLAPFSEGLEGKLFDFSYESLKAYPQFVERLQEVSGRRVDLWRGGIYRLVLAGEEELLEVGRHYAERGHKVEVLQPTELLGLSEEVRWILHYQEEAWVDVEQLMEALMSALRRLGAEFTVDRIREVCRQEDRVLELRGLVSTYGGDFYLFATGAWTGELFDLPVRPIKGQALKLRDAYLDRVHYSSLSYLIPRAGYLYVGATSEDVGFLPGNTLEGLKKLSEGALRVAPFLSGALVKEELYGYRPSTPDGKPIFEVGENYLIATGHYRNGILHAPITGQIALEYLKGSSSPFLKSFSSRRFLTKA